MSAVAELVSHAASWDRLGYEFQTPGWLAEAALEECWLWESEAERMVRAARATRDAIRVRMATLIGEGRVVRLGEAVYVVGWVPRRRVIDPKGLASWLGEDWSQAVRLDAGNLRVGGLRSLAERRGHDSRAVTDTFVETTWEGPALKAVPLARASTAHQKLAHGEYGTKGDRT